MTDDDLQTYKNEEINVIKPELTHIETNND